MIVSYLSVKFPSPQAVEVQYQLLIFKERKITMPACSCTNKMHLAAHLHSAVRFWQNL